ncbi:MAG: PepSY-associated TM helix domain-containing protein [Dokdonella sp.]|uniref:PepSY-associated TM helix domain-containing protein n=1 Tax=Dokdonella sp. TaxID=2291710 RepID=UPI003F80742E
MGAARDERDDAARRHRMIWRWHFYAGLFCIPFVLCLAVTGSVYLFRPQIEALLDQPYTGIATSTARATPSAQVRAALAAVPGSALRAYQLPANDGDAVQVLVDADGRASRVYVHPVSAVVLATVAEDARPMRVLARVHGELLLGDRGSMLVELAASWAIVMILTGLYLWWPRRTAGFGGVLYPRLRGGERIFWRDLHGVTAFWISGLVLFLLVSGLPWAKSWGSLLEEVRQWSGERSMRRDWPIGTSSVAASGVAEASAGSVGHHDHGAPSPMHADLAVLDRVVAAARPLSLAPPVLVSPPSSRDARWVAKSDAANRPRRTEASFDREGRLLARSAFAARPLIDRIVGYGVAAHEGQLFGVANQLLGVLAALGLVVACISAIRLWWRRRPAHSLGAPPPMNGARASVALLSLVAALGMLLPLLGCSLVAVVIGERLVLRRIPRAARFLGLA